MSVISVENVSEGERLSYSLPLLIGSVKQHISHHNFIFVKQNGKLINTWPICNGRFKIFVNLQPGENEFFLSLVHNETSDVDLKISLIYDAPRYSHFVRPVYIICSDHSGRFQGPEEEDCSVESAIKRITLSVKLLQSFIAEKLYEQGFKRKTFALESDLHQTTSPCCHIFKSKLMLNEVHRLSGSDLWMTFARELMSSDQFSNKNQCKWFAFMSFTRYCPPEGHLPPSSHNEILKMTKGHTALGGGGLALYGTGTLHCWAASLEELPLRFSDNRKMDRTRFMDDSAYREFLWANYSTGLGAALHELSHTFDLAHTSTGIMARGFDDLYRALASCHHIPSSTSTLSFISPLSSSPLSNYSLNDESPSSTHLVNPGSPKCSSLPTSPRCHVSTNKDPSRKSMMDGSPKPCCPPGRTSKCRPDDESPLHRARHNHNFYEGSKPLPLVVVETSFKKMNVASSHMTTFSDYDGSRTTQVVTRNGDGSETTLEISLRIDGRKVVKERIFNVSSKKSKVTLSMTIVSGQSKLSSSSSSLSSSSSSSSFYSASSSFYSVSSGTREDCDSVLKLPNCLERFQETRYADGGAHWYRSSAALLNCHKWFNNHRDIPSANLPSMDGFVITCASGLYLVELRTVLDGMVFHHYEFAPELDLDGGPENGVGTVEPDEKARNPSARSIATSFALNPTEMLSLAPPGEDDVGVLAMDRCGNILKRKLTYSQLVSSARSACNGSDVQTSFV